MREKSLESGLGFHKGVQGLPFRKRETEVTASREAGQPEEQTSGLEGAEAAGGYRP